MHVGMTEHLAYLSVGFAALVWFIWLRGFPFKKEFVIYNKWTSCTLSKCGEMENPDSTQNADALFFVVVVFPSQRLFANVEEDRLAIVSRTLERQSDFLRMVVACPTQQTDNFPTENISLAADPTDSLVSER